MKQESLPVRIAKASLSYLMEHGKVLPAFSEPVPTELQQPAGVFVSLKKQGQLRGCIGTILPTQSDAATEIIRNAVSAATADPQHFVQIRTGFGGRRMVDWLAGEQLPRIC